MGSWNVHTLVECSGDVGICQKRQVIGERAEVLDRKLDLLVGDLKRYSVSGWNTGEQVVWERCLASSRRLCTQKDPSRWC